MREYRGIEQSLALIGAAILIGTHVVVAQIFGWLLLVAVFLDGGSDKA